MPRTKEGWVDWTKCPARGIILADLEDGILSMEESVTSAEDAWNVYRDLPEFTGVAFDQFKTRLKDHREQVKVKFSRSSREEAAFVRDCARRPFPPTHNHRGERIFNHSPAQLLLRNDVKNRVHETMPPAALRMTRPEYVEFSLNQFRPRIYQEVRYQKFVYWLQKKRDKKKDQKATVRGPQNYTFPKHKRAKK